MGEFTHMTLGKGGIDVCRLGLSGTYHPGKETIYRPVDQGLNYFFCYGFDHQVIRTLQDLFQTPRQELVVAMSAYNLIWDQTDLRKTLEKRLRQLRTDYISTCSCSSASRAFRRRSQSLFSFGGLADRR